MIEQNIKRTVGIKRCRKGHDFHGFYCEICKREELYNSGKFPNTDPVAVIPPEIVSRGNSTWSSGQWVLYIALIPLCILAVALARSIWFIDDWIKLSLVIVVSASVFLNIVSAIRHFIWRR